MSSTIKVSFECESPYDAAILMAVHEFLKGEECYSDYLGWSLEALQCLLGKIADDAHHIISVLEEERGDPVSYYLRVLSKKQAQQCQM
jgi:hypothetical protein